MSENSDKNSEVKLIPNENGRGALLSGGLPGNKGGPGRTPSAIRASLRESFDKRIKIWEDIADNETLDPRVRKDAVEMLAKYGLGTKTEVTGDNDGPVQNELVITFGSHKAGIDDEN